MLFNSIYFTAFFVIVYLLYRILNHRLQNILLLLSSYFFYASWDWRFLGLILITTCVDYFCALRIAKETIQRRRKFFLVLSVTINLVILGYFKYFNFFAAGLKDLGDAIGFHFGGIVLNIALPVGISFYTFKSLSYTFDVYRREIEPTRSFLDYGVFVAFFPQLLAGPIERAKNLLPQIARQREITALHIKEGLWLIYWGIFKKVFMADNLAHIADAVFRDPGAFSGSEALIGVYAFTFQIYGDFSGYSDVARGLAKLMGIETMVNFRFPYFVTNPRDFWRNWHISLSTWLRDYLYIPMGGNRGPRFSRLRNLFVTMLLGGLWHGAGWTYVCWGAYHGLLLIIHRLAEPLLKKIRFRGNIVNSSLHIFKVLFMFHLTCFGWLIFRAESIQQLLEILRKILVDFSFNGMAVKYYGLLILFYASLVMVAQFLKSRKNDVMIIFKWPAPVRASVIILIFYLTITWGEFGGKQFIYLQF